MLLAPRLAFEGALPYQSTVGLQPGRGAPGTGQQGQRPGGHGLSPLQQGDLGWTDRRAGETRRAGECSSERESN